MNVAVTIETINKDQSSSLNTFEYDYDATKVRFMKKMADEVKEQMGQNILPAQMEEMMRQSHPEAIFNFAVCSDWIIDNIDTIAQAVRSDKSDSYRVVSFEMFDDDQNSIIYDGNHAELKEMLGYMNNDFNEMVKSA